jgi:hypothetical protein
MDAQLVVAGALLIAGIFVGAIHDRFLTVLSEKKRVEN